MWQSDITRFDEHQKSGVLSLLFVVIQNESSDLKKNKSLPRAVVLTAASAGIATVRGIAEAGIPITAIAFHKREPVHFSRFCKTITLAELKNDQAGLLDWLIQYAKGFELTPVLIPTSDKLALFLANNSEVLSQHYLIWKNSGELLESIINKDQLYSLADNVSVQTIPSIAEPSTQALENWVVSYGAPYIMKPNYEGTAKSALKVKNETFSSSEEILSYVEQFGTSGTVIQQLLRGGDGNIYDCYGLACKDKSLQSLSTHRRWRQLKPDVGSTSYGEIPASNNPIFEKRLVESTRKLVEASQFHGIFGVEWLHDPETNEIYMIDFNARPFSSIGHLHSCGVNLPLLAYYDLIDGRGPNELYNATASHKFWVDIIRDFWSFGSKQKNNQISTKQWLISLLGCRCFAYWRINDPLPGFYRMFLFSKLLTGVLGNNVKSFFKKTLRKAN